MTLEDELAKAIAAGDAAQCVALTKGRSEATRKELAGAMLRAVERAHATAFGRRGGEGGDEAVAWETRVAVLHAAQTAWLATTSRPTELKKLAWRGIAPAEHAAAVLEDRRPKWIVQWAELVCEVAPDQWPMVRAMVRSGLCPKPTSDGYVLGMVLHGGGRRFDSEQSPLTLFDKDPALLDDEAWRIFEVEGNREASLTATERTWNPALLELARTGRMDRGRMLDATLDALARDFAQHKAGFYARLHASLAPTEAEKSARVARYLALFASRIGPTVSLAAEALATLREVADEEALLAAAPRAMSTRSKAAVKTVLALLDRVAKKNPARAGEVARAAVGALEQESPELQGAALGLLEAYGAREDAGLVESVRERLGAVAPTLRKRAEAWLGAPEKTLVEVARAEPPRESAAEPWLRALARVDECARAAERGEAGPPVELTGARRPPRMDPASRLSPVETVDALFEAVARALESEDDPTWTELVLDGAARLGSVLRALPPERVKPLRKRARSLADRRWGRDVSSFVAEWLEGEREPEERAKHRFHEKPSSPMALFERRASYVLTALLAGRKPLLLSTPTHRAGWIDPRVLARRALSVPEPADATKPGYSLDDAVLALLRLAPEFRDEALAIAERAPGDFGAALRYALGGARRGHPGPDALWIAAARARFPGGDDTSLASELGEVGPDGAIAAAVSFAWREKRWSHGSVQYLFYLEVSPTKPDGVPSQHPTVLMYGDALEGGEPGDVRRLASQYPASRTGFFAMGARALQGNLDWSGAEWGNHAFLEPLLDPDVSLDLAALTTLAVGLAAKETREHGLAVDALIAAIGDGRLAGPELGAAMCTLWDPVQAKVGGKHGQRPSGSRWAKTLGLAAKPSPLHAECVRATIESLIERFDPASEPADLHALLALWLELCAEAETGVCAKSARAKLEALEGGGKVASGRKALLARPTTPSALAKRAAELALAARHARAERWSAWLRANEPPTD